MRILEFLFYAGIVVLFSFPKFSKHIFTLLTFRGESLARVKLILRNDLIIVSALSFFILDYILQYLGKSVHANSVSNAIFALLFLKILVFLKNEN